VTVGFGLALTGLALGQGAQPRPGGRVGHTAVRQLPMPDRVALAECIVVGKVIELEDKTVSAVSVAGATEKTEYQVAVVKIDQALLGAADLTHLRVGFIKPQPVRDEPGQFRPHIRYAQVSLAVDQEVCLFLNKLPEESLYVVRGTNSVLDKKVDENFARDLKLVQRCVKLLKDPKASLQAKSEEDRLLTAALLVYRYRTPLMGSQTRPIEAGESKLILQALKKANWDKNYPDLGNISAMMVFYRLGLGARDGWTMPQPNELQQDPQAPQKKAKKWLENHAPTYRIQRYVPEEKK
jgi:hypothetical protein